MEKLSLEVAEAHLLLLIAPLQINSHCKKDADAVKQVDRGLFPRPKYQL